MKNKLQHINSEKQSFAKKILNHINNLANQQYYIDLGFLDPSEVKIVENLIVNSGIGYYIESLYDKQERKRVFIGDVTYRINSLVAIGHYNNKFNQIDHRHVLGTLINADIDFKEFGDIIINEDSFQVICSEVGYKELELKFNFINKAKVSYKLAESVNYQEKVVKQEIIIVTSMRLDNIVKSIIRVSRSKAQKQIKSKLVKVNYLEIININHEVRVDDLIAIRKFGRRQIKAIEHTRSGKYKVTIE